MSPDPRYRAIFFWIGMLLLSSSLAKAIAPPLRQSLLTSR